MCTRRQRGLGCAQQLVSCPSAPVGADTNQGCILRFINQHLLRVTREKNRFDLDRLSYVLHGDVCLVERRFATFKLPVGGLRRCGLHFAAPDDMAPDWLCWLPTTYWLNLRLLSCR